MKSSEETVSRAILCLENIRILYVKYVKCVLQTSFGFKRMDFIFFIFLFFFLSMEYMYVCKHMKYEIA